MYLLAEHITKSKNNRDEEKGREKKEKQNRPIHHSACKRARQSKGVKTGTNKITNNLTIALSNCLSSVFSCLFVFYPLFHSFDSLAR